MKSRASISIAMTLCASLISFPLAAQGGNNLSSAPREYTLEVLPGPPGLTGLANANSINDLGWVTGLSNPSTDTYDRAVLWRNGQPTDLGTLGGYNSAGPQNNRNDIGWVVGTSETLEKDPYHENFGGFGVGCSAHTKPHCAPLTQISKGYLWRSTTNTMIALPPLPGGNNSFGVGANNQEMFGYSETGVMDKSCPSPQVFRFEGVVWSLGSDGTPFVSRRLSPVADDTVSFGLGINEDGDIVGGGGPCAAFETHAVLWKNDGSVIELGNLGGATNVAIAINNQGQVVGNSVLPDGVTTHAFLWEEGSAMQDLGTLPGDVQSTASAINDSGEVVGTSYDSAGNSRGFHWQGGVMTDLSALPSVSRLVQVSAGDINSSGEIAIVANDPSVSDPNDPTGFLQIAAALIPVGRTPAAIPAHSTSPNAEASGTGVVSGPNVTVSPTRLYFHCVWEWHNCPPPPATVTLTNVGSTILSITRIYTSSALYAFSQTNNCGSSLAAGKSCTISVKFNPKVGSYFYGAVIISDNGGGSPQQVQLNGTTLKGFP
jgi:probable HAF family extracellular repeat protein